MIRYLPDDSLAALAPEEPPPFGQVRVVVAERVFRTGRQSLLVDAAGRWHVRLVNRTNDTTVEVPEAKAAEWRRRLTR